MGFIQIIEYESDRIEEILALGKARLESAGPLPTGSSITITQDRDHPNRYYTIVEFPSYEVAMANSDDPATHEFAMKLAELCTSPPKFLNLDVVSVS